MPVTTTCVFRIGERTVTMSVRPEDVDAWRWEIRLDSKDASVANGMMRSKVAGQVAAQIALETLLSRQDIRPQIAIQYGWVEDVS